MIRMKFLIIAIAFLFIGTPRASADEIVDSKLSVVESGKLPVFYDRHITRPYEVLGQVEVKKKRLTAFSGPPSTHKLKLKLLDKARKLGGDAVIGFEIEQEGMSPFSFGGTVATGTAIKFKPVAARQ